MKLSFETAIFKINSFFFLFFFYKSQHLVGLEQVFPKQTDKLRFLCFIWVDCSWSFISINVLELVPAC